MNLYAKLLETLNLISKQNLQALIAGGFAYSVYAQPRATADIDLLTLVATDETVDRLTAVFPGCIVHKTDFNYGLLSVKRVVSTIDEDALVFDILTIHDAGFLESIASRITEIEMGGVKHKILSCEDLYILKMFASRPRDIEDCGELSRLEEFDAAYVNRMIEHLKTTGFWK